MITLFPPIFSCAVKQRAQFLCKSFRFLSPCVDVTTFHAISLSLLLNDSKPPSSRSRTFYFVTFKCFCSPAPTPPQKKNADWCQEKSIFYNNHNAMRRSPYIFNFLENQNRLWLIHVLIENILGRGGIRGICCMPLFLLHEFVLFLSRISLSGSLIVFCLLACEINGFEGWCVVGDAYRTIPYSIEYSW